MTRSVVELPPDVGDDFNVYLNGVRQHPAVDFQIDGRTLIFERPLRKDRVSGWRWFLGAWGVGTYRQDDTIDISYEIDGDTRLAHALPIIIDTHADQQPSPSRLRVRPESASEPSEPA
jgi:hypothetical protein